MFWCDKLEKSIDQYLISLYSLMNQLYNFAFVVDLVCEYMVMHCLKWYIQLHSLLPLGTQSGTVCTKSYKGGSHVI